MYDTTTHACYLTTVKSLIFGCPNSIGLGGEKKALWGDKFLISGLCLSQKQTICPRSNHNPKS